MVREVRSPRRRDPEESRGEARERERKEEELVGGTRLMGPWDVWYPMWVQ